MPIERVAVIYDNSIRPETTGGYCLRALEKLAQVEHFPPSRLDQIQAGTFDLFLNIDDGLQYRFPDRLRPSAWWAIDTHLDAAWYLKKAPDFDFIFTAQRDGCEQLSRAGIPRVRWLPLAADPEVHCKWEIEKSLDFCFVGNLVGVGVRGELIALLKSLFSKHFVGQRYFEEMAQTYCSSRMVFNRGIRDDVNMRVFEALACGSLLVTNDLKENGQAELFQDGMHLATYQCAEELVDKMRFYLRHEAIRERIAAAGREQVLDQHTYRHRMQEILRVVSSGDERRRGAARSGMSAVTLRKSTSTVERSGQNQQPTLLPDRLRLRVLYLGVFSKPWTIEHAVAESMRRLGHEVEILDEQAARSPESVLRCLQVGDYNCLLFSKGRIGRKSQSDFLFTTGEDIACVLERTSVPGYTWYFDRAHGFEPSREQWMRRVGPLCRIAFVVDEALTRTDWANWYVLQQGFRVSDLRADPPPDQRRQPVGFIGSVYGPREQELEPVARTFGLNVISDAYGPERHQAIKNHEIILGPRFPGRPGYWSDRIYLVLGHGGFFLAPEVEGMREEGFIPGVHYARLGDDPTADIHYWLDRPHERERIARAGQELVLNRFTYDHRASELCWVITQSLPASRPTPHRPAKGRQEGRDAPVILTDSTGRPDERDSKAGVGSSLEAHRHKAKKDTCYYDWPRLDLLEMVPLGARRVLDIGCGAGKLGELLKARQKVEVVGIELDADAAEIASSRLDRVVVGDVEAMTPDFRDESFDCVICGDLLEHLIDPEGLLRRAKQWLVPRGMLIASVPNARHHGVVTGLLEGNWTYETAGLLDETHLQFFTRRDTQRLFEEAGYTTEITGTSPFPELKEWRSNGRSRTISLGHLEIAGSSPEDAEEFYVYQYLVRAISCSAQPSSGRVAIVPTRATTQGAGPAIQPETEAGERLGCVMSVRNRDPETLERTFQTFAYQTVSPVERLLLDFGSDPKFSRAYRQICERFGWTFKRAQLRESRWHAAAAHNLAVSLLRAEVETVFKSDIDVLLSPNVLEIAARIGRTTFCQFRQCTTDSSVVYPPQFQSVDDLYGLFKYCPKSGPSVGTGICAFPRSWFESNGGFDLKFRQWGYEDNDLRVRAGRTIGVHDVDYREALLIHQWHEATDEARNLADTNREYFEQMLESDPVRNGGIGLRKALQELICRVIGGKPGAKPRPKPQISRSRRIQISEAHAGKLPPRRRTSKMAPGDCDLTSIVIVVHNLLDRTRRCIESVRRFTAERVEVIVVDNGSNEPTRSYLQSLSEIHIVENSENRGFPSAVNQGITVARGSQVLVLHNDTVVTEGWLTRMLGLLSSSPDIGLVGPSSNAADGFQKVPETHAVIEDLDSFARRWAQTHAGRAGETDFLSSFCLLIRRDLIDRIGLFDERFRIGGYEDRDYCVRATQDGYRILIAWDAYVHHAGSETFRARGLDPAMVLRDNEQVFVQKWASEPPDPSAAWMLDARSPPRFRLRSGRGPGLLLARQPILVSLCMIVRDSARTLPACLESVRQWVDEMVIVDTGSRDNTPEIARRYGARLFHLPWCDSFAAARNESVRHARGQWIFWMDSDDTISAENGRLLRQLVCNPVGSAIYGFVAQVHCPGPNPDEVTAVDHVKLFRNVPYLGFEGRIHEQILPSIRRAGGQIAWTDLFVLHSGSDQSAQGRKGKQERDLHLLELELREKPDDSFTLFNIGMTYADMDEHPKAIEALERSLALSNSSESHVRKIFALLVASLARTDQFDTASDVCQRGLREFPDDAELLFRAGTLAHRFGRLEEAETCYLSVLHKVRERHFSSVDRGIGGYKARQNLAAVYTDMGRLADAERLWREVVKEKARYREGWHGLGESLVRQGKLDEAERVAEQLGSESSLVVEGILLRTEIAKARGDIPLALELFRHGAEEDGDPWLLRGYCQLLFERGDFETAEKLLLRLVERQPDDASAYCNLATVHFQLGRLEDAIRCYAECLKLRPDSELARKLLDKAVCAKQSGRLQGDENSPGELAEPSSSPITIHSPRAKSRQFAVVSICTPQMRHLGRFSTPNKRSYCERHGYTFVLRESVIEKRRHPVWARIPLLLELLDEFEWLFWTDADSLIMNPGITLGNLRDVEADLVITKDANGLNNGNFLITNRSGRARPFLAAAYEQMQYLGHPLREQAAMAHLLENGSPPLLVRYLPKRSMNAYSSDYQPGDFLLHFAGQLARVYLMYRYSGLLDRDRSKIDGFCQIASVIDERRFSGAVETLKTAADLLQAGKPTAAYAVAKDLAVRAPGEPRVLHLLGMIDFHLGCYDEAFDSVCHALVKWPGSEEIHRDLSVMLKTCGLDREAEEHAHGPIVAELQTE